MNCRYKKYSLLMLLVLTILAVTGCSGSSGEEPVTTDFAEDTVFTVADERVSLSEWYLYAEPRIEETENFYGSSIWIFPVSSDGETFAEAMKENIRERITYVRIVCGRAESMGIGLNEDELIDINIQTEDYMAKLDADIAEKYGITAETVKKVYTDNLLAMKVYENLTLNIDTYIPEDEVRHMVLQYIAVMKSMEEDDGTVTEYTEEELEALRRELIDLSHSVNMSESGKTLNDLNDNRFIVIELTADYSELTEKLSQELADVAFALGQNEASSVIETKEALFLLNCVERTDKESTDAVKIEIIEERQQALFEEKYSEWESNTIIKLNYGVWDEIVIE